MDPVFMGQTDPLPYITAAYLLVVPVLLALPWWFALKISKIERHMSELSK